MTTNTTLSAKVANKCNLDKSGTASQKRIAFIDLAKGLCILLVVFNHVTDPSWMFNQFVGLFRMPLYFFLSGLFFKDYGAKIFLLKKLNKLLIPYILLYTTTIIGLESIVCFVNKEPYDWEILYSYWPMSSYHNTPIWFLLCLFELNMIFLCVYKICKKNIVLIILMSLAIGWIGYTFMPHTPCYLGTSFTVVPFFMCGYLFKNFTSILIPNKFDKWSLWFVLLGGVVMVLLLKMFAEGIPYVSYGWNLYEMDIFRLYILGVIGILAILLIAKHFNYFPYISYIGRYSIIILGTHQLVHLLLLNKLWDYLPDSVIFILLKFVSCVLISSLCIPFCKKYLPYFFAQKDLIKPM